MLLACGFPATHHRIDMTEVRFRICQHVRGLALEHGLPAADQLRSGRIGPDFEHGAVVVKHATVMIDEQDPQADQIQEGRQTLALVVAAQQVVLTQGLSAAQLGHRLEQCVLGLLARLDILGRQAQAASPTPPVHGDPHHPPIARHQTQLEILRQAGVEHLPGHAPTEIAIRLVEQERKEVPGRNAVGRRLRGEPANRGTDPGQTQRLVEQGFDAVNALGQLAQAGELIVPVQLAPPDHKVLTNTFERR